MPFGRYGFTLLEVLVAIVIGSIVLLGARTIMDQLGDTADRVTAAAVAADRAANTERTVRGLLRRAIAGEATPFIGSPTHTRFTSWCDVPAGWQERCAVAIDLFWTGMPPSAAAVLRTSAGDTIELYNDASHVRIAYLDDPAHGGRWAPGWSAPEGMPLAIRVATERDTLLLRIGERR